MNFVVYCTNMSGKKVFIFFMSMILIVLCAISLSACKKGGAPNDLVLRVSDVKNAPAGEYTLSYSIDNYNVYAQDYKLRTSVYVYDASNNSVFVRNNLMFTVEYDQVYTVVVVVYGTDQKDKPFELSDQFSIEAAHPNRTVTFYDYSDEVILFGPYEVEYGKDFSEPLPEVPDHIEEEEDYDTTIAGKRWVVYYSDKEVPLQEQHLKNIRSNVYIYPSYDYVRMAKDHTITFVANGGSETEVYHGNASTITSAPAKPTREGYVFLGWCTDEELTDYYGWAQNQTLTEDLTLYAKWAEIVTDATGDNYFNFTLETDAYGNSYYSIAAKDPLNLYGDLVLPNYHNGLPITNIQKDGFKGAHIQSVKIPNTYNMDHAGAFFGCDRLQIVLFDESCSFAEIGAESFCDCAELKLILLPNTVRRIQPNAFRNCISLENIILPSGLVYLNDHAFYGCKNLKSVALPDQTQYIMDSAFEGCEKLTEFSVSIDSRIYQIERKVLLGTGVTEVWLPARMESKNPFSDCANVVVRYYEPKTE